MTKMASGMQDLQDATSGTVQAHIRSSSPLDVSNWIADTVDLDAVSPGATGNAALGKLLGYLLNPDHPKGRSKARLLFALGFSPAESKTLDQAIRRLIRHAVGRMEERDGRLMISFEGILVGPPPDSLISGRRWAVIVQWEDHWRLVTLKPTKSPAE